MPIPAKFPLDVLDVIAGHPRICKYLDMPVQHASDAVLKSMRRGISARALRRAPRYGPPSAFPVSRSVPPSLWGIPRKERRSSTSCSISSAPGSSTGSACSCIPLEEGTTAYPLGDPVPQAEKERRLGLVMELQREIALAKNEALIGSRVPVLVEREEDGRFVGRTGRDAPEIDNEVYITSARPLPAGTIQDVLIDDATEYDLYGTADVVGSFSQKREG